MVEQTLQGRVALISGAGGGKGLELTRLLAARGATVFVTDAVEQKVRDHAHTLALGDQIRPIKLDVGVEEDWIAAMSAVQAACGRLDMLFHTARLFGPGALTEVSIERWRSLTAVNLDGAFLAAKHGLPLMIAGGGGAIVNLLSISALHPVADLPAYGACNAAVLNLTKYLATSYGKDNVRANAVICGFSENSPLDDTHELARRIVPLGRPATPVDIARAAAWLASDDAAYCTGTTTVLDGGLSVGLKL